MRFASSVLLDLSMRRCCFICRVIDTVSCINEFHCFRSKTRAVSFDADDVVDLKPEANFAKNEHLGSQ